MHCLLCHEKIPRLRAWTGKSEFCCDEHAELYKKQTIDRLLVDDSGFKSAAPALPITDAGAPSVDHILLKDQPGKAQGEAPSVDHILLKAQPSRAKRTESVPEAGDVDELWKLADRMGDQEDEPTPHLRRDAPDKRQRDVQTQSADEALAALQALAAEALKSKRSDSDLFDELSRMESSFEGLPPLESLPMDLAAEAGHDELDEAPELELDALEWPQTKAQAMPVVEPIADTGAAEAVNAPELVLDALAEEDEEFLAPPELAADYDVERPQSLEPPDEEWEELRAVSDASDERLAEPIDPPEPMDLELETLAEENADIPAAPPVARRAPQAAPRLRPATELQEMVPSPSLPDGGYALQSWMDALAAAGPDSVSLLTPSEFSEVRKSSLNGTSSAKFDPVELRASERLASVDVPILEPEGPFYEMHDDALMPSWAFAWPAPLHAALMAAEMGPNGATQSVSAATSYFSVKQPTLSAEFLSRVALNSRVLEPKCSAILSPLDRGAYTAATAEEEEPGSECASASGRLGGYETDGGERANVADLF